MRIVNRGRGQQLMFLLAPMAVLLALFGATFGLVMGGATSSEPAQSPRDVWNAADEVCPEELTARAPSADPPIRLIGALDVTSGALAGFSPVLVHIDDPAYLISEYNTLPAEWFGSVLFDNTQFVRGTSEEADAAYTVNVVEGRRANLCHLVRSAAGTAIGGGSEDSGNASEASATPGEEPGYTSPREPPEGAEPYAQTVLVRGGRVAIVHPSQGQGSSAMILWMERDDLMIQIIANDLPERDMLNVAEQIRFLAP